MILPDEDYDTFDDFSNLDDTDDESDLIIADLNARLYEIEVFREECGRYLAMRERLELLEEDALLNRVLLAESVSEQPDQKEVNVREGMIRALAEKVNVDKPVSLERSAKVYGQPRNPWLRFLEFEDGSHGVLRVHKDHPSRVGWKVVVIPGEAPGVWSLAGRYNRWGVRMDNVVVV